MTATARFQLFRPAAVQQDGTLPPGFRGSDHWLWGKEPLAAVPRVDGERVVLLGPPAFRLSWGAERRFPAMPADVRVTEVLNPFRVAERLARLSGTAVPPAARPEPAPALAKAA